MKPGNDLHVAGILLLAECVSNFCASGSSLRLLAALGRELHQVPQRVLIRLVRVVASVSRLPATVLPSLLIRSRARRPFDANRLDRRIPGAEYFSKTGVRGS